MIDYEKLQLAHSLCMETEKNYFEVGFGIEDDLAYRLYGWDDYDGKYLDCYDDIDDLITKLRELTRPVDEEVWFLNYIYHDGIVFDEEGLETKSLKMSEIKQLGDYDTPRKLYPTKAALIEAQIEYWRNLQEKDCDNIDCYCENNGRCKHNMPIDDCFRCRLLAAHNEECKCNIQYFLAVDGICVVCNKPYHEECQHENIEIGETGNKCQDCGRKW